MYFLESIIFSIGITRARTIDRLPYIEHLPKIYVVLANYVQFIMSSLLCMVQNNVYICYMCLHVFIKKTFID